MELRCENRLHGIMDGDILERRCKSRFCGWRPGLVVIHRFNVRTAELIQTLVFKEPPNRRSNHGAGHSVSIRNA